MHLQHSFRLDVDPRTAAAVLCDEAYNLEVEQGRSGVVSCTFELTRRDGAGASFLLRTTEYARTRTGGLDPSRTFASLTRSELLTAEGMLRWTYDPEIGATRTSLSGTYRIEAEGAHARVTHDVRIDVGIPLIGGQIAKLLANEFYVSFPRVERLLRQHAVSFAQRTGN